MKTQKKWVLSLSHQFLTHYTSSKLSINEVLPQNSLNSSYFVLSNWLLSQSIKLKLMIHTQKSFYGAKITYSSIILYWFLSLHICSPLSNLSIYMSYLFPHWSWAFSDPIIYIWEKIEIFFVLKLVDLKLNSSLSNLQNRLLNGYNRNIRPVLRSDKITLVKIDFALMEVISMV